MTALDLVADLRAGLEKAAKHFKFPAQYAEPQGVKVFAHSMPLGDILDEKLYPLILIELQGINHSANSAVATILFTVGTYKENGVGGMEDNLLLAQEVTNFLLKNKLIGAASLLPDFDFWVAESTTDEFFFSQILAQYRIMKLSNNYLED